MGRRSNPSAFQGTLKKRSYFEGWYIKCLSDDLLTSLAFIPGISLGKNSHAFIQLNTSGHDTEYLKFPLEDFHYETDHFAVAIADNFFSDRGIHLDLERSGISIHGDLIFEDVHPFPSHFMAPGIMGWFIYVPFMECYHGVVSMRHKVRGSLTLNGKEFGFENGVGYIEKDWGRSFPESWIWMQANPFQDSNASFMLSIAKVPWMGLPFTGVIGFLNIDDKVYRFATYLGDKVVLLEQHDWGVDVVIGNNKHRLRLSAELGDDGGLIAPMNGEMSRSMKESLNSTLHVELSDKKGNIIFNDTSHIAGLEISGNAKSLSPRH
ncbi:MAG: tocopherol cyclase family protein [Candidatus Marinimicrobia bacterium]|nr:tocopherol cyclase family protein [Candidatus Neomarinimicrobiota bacterium]